MGELRASDADRQRIIAALERHTAAGRLDLEEFAQRMDGALAARTVADLAALTDDLEVPATGESADRSDSRHLGIAFLVAALTLVILGVVLALTR